MSILSKEDVAGVKLVQDDNFAPKQRVLMALDNAFTQGSQGWGVTPDVAVVASLAREVYDLQPLAAAADEAQRMLAGARLELGRVKKKVRQLEAEAEVAGAGLIAERLVVKARDEAIEKLAARVYERRNRAAGSTSGETGPL